MSCWDREAWVLTPNLEQAVYKGQEESLALG